MVRLDVSRPMALLSLLFAWAAFAPAHGQSPVSLDGYTPCVSITAHTEYLRAAKDVTLDTILGMPDDYSFEELPSKGVNFGIGDEVYWFRVALRHVGDKAQSYRLELNNPRLISVTCLQPGELGALYEQRSGTAYPYASRVVAHRNPSFLVNLDANETRTVYLRVMHQGSFRFIMRVWTPSAFNEHRAETSLIQGLFYGAIVLMAIQSFYVAGALRQGGFLIHGFLNVAYLMYTAAMQGVAYQYLWPNSPWWADKSILLFFGIAFALFFIFSAVFLETRRYAPRLGGVLLLCGFIAIAVGIGSMFGWVIFNQVGHALGMAGPPLIVVTAVVAWRRGHPLAPLFLLAWGFLLVGMFMLALLGQGVLPNTFWTENMLHIGAGLALLLFSFALTQQVKLLEIRYRGRLEDKVSERTTQLTEALENVKTLKGLIPICASCKKIRDDQGFWNRMETYLQRHSDADLTHSLCPDCATDLYGEKYSASPPPPPPSTDP